MTRFPMMLGLGLLLAGCQPAPPPVAPVVTQPPLLEFAVTDLAIAEQRHLVPTLPINGTLRPWREATVKARVAGELQELSVREGDSVHAGQHIGRIDAADYQARLSGLEAEVAAARATLAIAERNRLTQDSLLARGFISRNAYDTTQSNRDAAQARLEAAMAATRVGHKALADTTLVAPMAGEVSARLAQPGERVPVDGRIVTLVDVSKLELAATLPAAAATRLRVGAEVSLSVDGMADRTLTGHVERINPSAATGSRSIELYAVLPNPGNRLRGGLFAQGSVAVGAAIDAIVLPASAVREEAGKAVVYVIAGERLSRREVSLGMVQNDVVAITQGVATGERVVRHNLGPMKDGAAVKAVAVPSASTF